MAKALDQATTCALCEAGYLSTRDYIKLAAENGWEPDDFLAACERRQAPPCPRPDGDPSDLDVLPGGL